MEMMVMEEYRIRDLSDYYVTARTEIGGKELAYDRPDFMGGTIEAVLHNDTQEDYVTELIVKLPNSKQCLLRIVQKK